MTDGLTTNMWRYGSNAELPERQTLRAGPVTAVLENADLRYVRFGGAHLVLRLYMAVRNQNWDTIEPTFTGLTVDDRGDSFTVTFSAEHVAGDVDFAWDGSIEGAADGTISYRMDGAPRKPFLRNRIGFCVLHPMSLAGVPATVETPDGTVEGAFPEQISPHQPFIDMVSISHPAGPNGQATIRFEGDLFEMEDQRNWTDASYKTYGTPLRLPYPVEVTPADRIVQSVTLTVTGEPAAASASGPAADVMVDPGTLSSLPSIGFGAGSGPLPEAEDDLAPLAALRPDHLWAELDLGDHPAWRERLVVAADNAEAVGAALDLSVIGAGGQSAWLDLADAIRDAAIDVGRVFAFPPPAEPVIFPRGDLVTDQETIEFAKAAFAGTVIRVGGGTRAYFTELNRGTGTVPFGDLDVLTYTVNPQVHAFDTLSLIENIAAQATTVESTRAFAGDAPLVVGPITLRPQSNPNATSAPPPAPADQLPDAVDPRQLSLFGAGWTVGSISRLAQAGADALTYYELLGWRGLMERRERLTRRELFPSIPGGLFPLYHVFAAIALFGEPAVAAVTLAEELSVEALALRNSDLVRILVANLTNEDRDVRIDVPGLREATFRALDETTYEAATTDPAFFEQPGEPLSVDGGVSLTMHPFAIACVDGRLAQ